MNVDPIITAEIEVTQALLAQSQALRSRANPRRTIAAAQWEIRLQHELDLLKQKASKPEPIKSARANG